MANIKWSGIESWKYGLTARWYVSAYYGNDIDVDGVGYYNPTTNPTGHGGPTRPFASEGKIQQDSNISSGANVLYDSGFYTYTLTVSKSTVKIGDGVVVFSGLNINIALKFYNCLLLSLTSSSIQSSAYDCIYMYSSPSFLLSVATGCVFAECTNINNNACIELSNNTYINCSSFTSTQSANVFKNNIIINSPNFYIGTQVVRPAGVIFDYAVIIGTVKSNRTINGKTTGVTIEDFKIDGQYFVKSFSGVDLFGNPSGSGANVAQLQTIFNNYFSPIYLDTWQYADLSLKPTASDIVKFGGLNGTYIGALPVGYHYSSQYLWDNRNQTNTVDLELDSIFNYLQIAGTAEFGTYESNEIDLGSPIIIDPIKFFANLVYNADGTVKQGVANQRIDTAPDSSPDNTLNQRVVYSYELSYSPNGVDALSGFKPFELNRKPTIDAGGDTQLEDNFNVSEQTFITVQRFKIKFVLRKVVIS